MILTSRTPTPADLPAILFLSKEGPLIEELGGYRIEGELARGGMGVVYRALDPRSGRQVALKLLLDTDERFRERFARESQALARLNHPHVVRVHDAGEARGAPYLVMELVEGATLEALVKQGPLEVRRAVELVANAARGAGHAHTRGLVHRDIKPDNVLLRPNGEVVLTDFGLARDVEVSSDLSKTGIFMGTPGYASPEQAAGEGKHVGPASDVYGLGALLFALLCGRAPMTGTLLEILVLTISEPAPSARALNPAVDRTLDALTRRCMAKDPADRFSDGDALAEALEAYLRGELAAPPRVRAGAFLLVGLLAVVSVGVALNYASSRAPRRLGGASSSTPRLTQQSTQSSPSDTEPSGPEESGVLVRALRRTAKVEDGGGLDSAIKLMVGALERVGPASNRAQAEGRLAELYTRRSRAVLRRSPAETVADLRAARALEDTPARREALSAALVHQAMVFGGAMARGVEWERAKEAYREAAELLPNDPNPVLQLGEQARARKDYPTWLSANEEAARRAPQDERPQVQIARALVRAEQTDLAFARLRAFLEEQPEAPKAWQELGHLERSRSRWARARQAYERAGGESSQDPQLLEGLAYVALEERRPALALALAKRAVGTSRRDKVATVRALAHPRSGDKESVLRAFEEAWGSEESEPWLCQLALGHLEALRRHGGEADARLEFYLAEPSLGRHAGLVLRLIHYGSTKRHEESNKVLREIQRLRGSALDPRADCALGGWLSQWGTYDLPDFALLLARRAARTSKDDEDAAALVLRGQVLMRLDRHEEAWAALDQALEIHPTRADLHHVRAELGGSSGRLALGVESGRRALELQPGDPYTCVYLAWSLLGLGRAREALPVLDLAESKIGSHVAGLRALARACAGEFEGARLDLKRARAKDPKARAVSLTNALLLAEGGDREGAAKIFRAALEDKIYPYERALVERELKRIEAR